MSGTPPDPSRRRFFREFAGQVVSSAAQVVGAVAEIRDQSAAEAQALLRGDEPGAPSEGATTAATGRAGGGTPAVAGARGGVTTAAADQEAPTGFRTPFRFDPTDDHVLLVIDQRALPDRLVELAIRNAYDGARAIKEMAVRGAPAIGQVAALSFALSGWLCRNAPPRSREPILRAAAKFLAESRPTAVNLGWAIRRVNGALEAATAANLSGAEAAVAMMAEANRIVAEATDDHGRLADHGLAALPEVGARELRLLTHCNTGPLACGQFGTALGVVQAAHIAKRPLHVWVDETRPYLQGARLTAWELAQAGVPHTLIADVAAGSLLAAGRVDAVLVGADRVAANGDVANKVGTYPLAVLAARHGVPFLVCAPISSVDLETPDGGAIPIEERAATEVVEVRGQRIAPAGTAVFNPAFDITPAELISGIVTEEGVLRAPFGPALRAAAAARAARASDAAQAAQAGQAGRAAQAAQAAQAGRAAQAAQAGRASEASEATQAGPPDSPSVPS